MIAALFAQGYKADLNVIDLDQLTLHAPEILHDLPAGGRRLVQGADGYIATLVDGVPIARLASRLARARVVSCVKPEYKLRAENLRVSHGCACRLERAVNSSRWSGARL